MILEGEYIVKKKITVYKLHEVMDKELKDKGVDASKIDKDLLENILKTIYKIK